MRVCMRTQRVDMCLCVGLCLHGGIWMGVRLAVSGWVFGVLTVSGWSSPVCRRGNVPPLGLVMRQALRQALWSVDCFHNSRGNTMHADMPCRARMLACTHSSFGGQWARKALVTRSLGCIMLVAQQDTKVVGLRATWPNIRLHTDVVVVACTAADASHTRGALAVLVCSPASSFFSWYHRRSQQLSLVRVVLDCVDIACLCSALVHMESAVIIHMALLFVSPITAGRQPASVLLRCTAHFVVVWHMRCQPCQVDALKDLLTERVVPKFCNTCKGPPDTCRAVSRVDTTRHTCRDTVLFSHVS
jgi:hypothetical protein